MANQIVALNSYDNASGNRKALGFSNQDVMLQYIHDNLDEKRQVLWKGMVTGNMGINQIKAFYRTINGSLARTLVKDYFRETKHKRDPVPIGYTTPNKYVETFVNLWQFIDESNWLVVWKV
jgi:hypothetical protein